MPISSCQILWSTQSGRAKACARRTSRILTEQATVELQGGAIGSSFDEAPVPFVDLVSSTELLPPSTSLLIMFVSTTGDGEQCDSIRDTWKSLLQKSLPKNIFAGKQFALFCLGDRAYGPQFCAAGRKLAVRLLQLGMTSACEVGYGDDNTPNGGIFRDLDAWLEDNLLPILERKQYPSLSSPSISSFSSSGSTIRCPFEVQVVKENACQMEKTEEWKDPRFAESYRAFFANACPVTAYSYSTDGKRLKNHFGGEEDSSCQRKNKKSSPLLGSVTVNQRITAADWDQDTRHLRIHIVKPLFSHSSDQQTMSSSGVSIEELPYNAGDVASILPSNSEKEVENFIQVLPQELAKLADSVINIDIDKSLMNNSFTAWPQHCTLRGWLTYCADIHSLPEREDLRALSWYCSPTHELGMEQGEKLRSLSETSEAALYADYILREKRSWADVLYDFESLRAPGSGLTLEALLMLLPAIRPRDFSIASAPSMAKLSRIRNHGGNGSEDACQIFFIELCVAVVKGTTRLGRQYHGLCSEFISRMIPTQDEQPHLQIWIRPGTFGKLPLELGVTSAYKIPIICVGSGTGVAPMRSLLLERDAVWSLAVQKGQETKYPDKNDNILVFGCRKKDADFYYQDEWLALDQGDRIRILTAFSRDQFQKIYVQKVLREADGGDLIANHILQRGGAVYIAGGPKMARGVKEEIVEVLAEKLGGEKQANQLLNRLQRAGRFSIEAWS